MSEYDWVQDTILVRSWATSNHLYLLTFCVHAVNMGPLVHWTFATPLTWDLNPSTHLGNFFKQLFWLKRSNWPTYYLIELSIVQPEVINYFWLSRWPLIILTLVFFPHADQKRSLFWFVASLRDSSSYIWALRELVLLSGSVNQTSFKMVDGLKPETLHWKAAYSDSVARV